MIQPHRAYFGQKDGLQVMTIRRLVSDLNFPVAIVSCPTIREPDGLAKSSRNIYLNRRQRELAPTLYSSLLAVQSLFESGNRRYDELVAVGRKALSHDAYRVEYFSICNAVSGEEFSVVEDLPETNIMVSAAITFGTCRLIDNILLPHRA